jgi:hypothetical protein
VAGKYNAVPAVLWDRHLREQSPDPQRLYLYNWTNRHRNSEGIYWLPTAYIEVDLKLTSEEVRRALVELSSLLRYDHDAEVLLDLNALRYRQPKGWRQLRGAVNVLVQVPDTPLLATFFKLAEQSRARPRDRDPRRLPRARHQQDDRGDRGDQGGSRRPALPLCNAYRFPFEAIE